MCRHYNSTESAAEGVNLQFCSLVINYDRPWNPQRIEQRIGRCHRYGQKNDVVVINFINKRNYADVRVHELLDEKFSLFKGDAELNEKLSELGRKNAICGQGSKITKKKSKKGGGL